MDIPSFGTPDCLWLSDPSIARINIDETFSNIPVAVKGFTLKWESNNCYMATSLTASYEYSR
jgi:hypothetical protein